MTLRKFTLSRVHEKLSSYDLGVTSNLETNLVYSEKNVHLIVCSQLFVTKVKGQARVVIETINNPAHARGAGGG